MIWANIIDGFDYSYAGAQGPYFGKHGNPNLMNAMLEKNGLASLPDVRSDALIFGGGVSAVRFIKSRSYAGKARGYMAFAVVNGAAVVVARSDKLLDLEYYPFFRTEIMCCDFVNQLKNSLAIEPGARVSLECLSADAEFALGAPPKMIAYTKLRVATTDKYKAGRMQADLTLYAATALQTDYLMAALDHVNAWSQAADVRHAVALQNYQALGGLI